VVVRRASAASGGIVPDVPQGFERIAPNLNRAGDQHSHLQNLRLNFSPCHCLGVF
jgi:hypothetical protein